MTNIKNTSEKVEEVNYNYPTELLVVELAQQAAKNPQLELFSKETLSKVNHTIDEVLRLQRTSNPNHFYVYFPLELEKKLDRGIRSQISKEITANEVRVLTAVVILAQIAMSKNALNYIQGLDRAWFELNLQDLYKVMGSSKGGRQRQEIKEALWGLNRKKYSLVKNRDGKKKIAFTHLVEVHEMEADNTNLVKVTVEGLFFNFEDKKSTYFHIPSDINSRLRKATKGRPNAYVERFIKCLYQAKHCAKNNQVEYSYSTIYELMGLYKLKENRNGRLIKPTIEKAFEMAIQLEVIASYIEGKDRFGGIKYIITFI